MSHIGHEILPCLELGIDTSFALDRRVRDRIGGKLCDIDFVFHQSCLKSIGDEASHTLSLIRVNVAFVGIDIVGDIEGIVSPWAVVGIVDIVEKLVHIAFGFF